MPLFLRPGSRQELIASALGARSHCSHGRPAAVAGSLSVQAAVVVGLVWWMLIGGAHYAYIGLSRGDGSDAAGLASRTPVPWIVWHTLWPGDGWLLRPG